MKIKMFKIVDVETSNLKFGWGENEILWQKYKHDKVLNKYIEFEEIKK